MHVVIRYLHKGCKSDSYDKSESRGYILGVYLDRNGFPSVMFASETGLVFSIRQMDILTCKPI